MPVGASPGSGTCRVERRPPLRRSRYRGDDL